MSIGIRVNKDKIGHLMVYLATQIVPIYHPTLLRLLYLIDEAAVRQHGVPVTWLDYHVWEYGPVAPEASELHQEENHFSDYVAAHTDDSGTTLRPLKAFSDAEFSDQELELIDQIIALYATHSPEELLHVIQQEGSLWHATHADAAHLASPSNRAAAAILDLTRLLDDEVKQCNYRGAKEMMHFRLPPKA